MGAKLSPTTIERALLATARLDGNASAAARLLNKEGIGGAKLTAEKIRGWINGEHRERYAAIRAEVMPEIKAELRDAHISLAKRQMAVEHMLLDRMEDPDVIAEMPVKELPGAGRNVAVGGAVHTDKARELDEGPAVRVSYDLSGLLRDLRSLGVETIEGEAQEEPLPQVGA